VERWRDLFNISYDVLLYDLTSTYFEADPPFSGRRQARFWLSLNLPSLVESCHPRKTPRRVRLLDAGRIETAAQNRLWRGQPQDAAAADTPPLLAGCARAWSPIG
jgi:hypothetical protein